MDNPGPPHHNTLTATTCCNHFVLRSYVALACCVLCCVGLLGYFFLVAPWSKTKSISLGMSEHSLLEVMGDPDATFYTNTDLNESFVGASYLFTAMPGPSNERPPGIAWAQYSLNTSSAGADALPIIAEKAYWYDLPLTAGILIYISKQGVDRVYHGGT